MTCATTLTSLPDPDRMWTAVLSRDPAFDGRFVYAVRSTGVFCRPTCPSRRPRQSQALYFTAPSDALRAGFRPCLRCRPEDPFEEAELARRVVQHIDDSLDAEGPPPSSSEISEALGISVSRLNRSFRRQTGFTPAQYARAKRLERFKATVRGGANVSDAMYDAGYGSSSRLYENAGRQLGMTPATYRKGGSGAVVRYIVTDSSLGGLLVAGTSTGVCAVKLGDDAAGLEAELREEFPAAEIVRIEPGENSPASHALRTWVQGIQHYLDGTRLDVDLPLDVLATAFQWRVWRQLRAIPAGETRTYQQMALELEQPTASRAVGRACATNPVAPIIPCHRAVRKDGGLAGYRWGLHRKEALLEMERKQRG